MRTIAAVIVAAYLAFVVVKASVASRAESVSSAETSLARPNFLVGVAQLGALHENGTRCGRELETLLKAVAAKEFWSIKGLCVFIDAAQSAHFISVFNFFHSILLLSVYV